MTTDRDRGLLAGILLSSGSFGGDGKQPQVTLRMHTRHEALLQWMVEQVPGSRLYGPYHHGDRSYFQWMARGDALVHELLPVLEETFSPDLDEPAYERLQDMTGRYAEAIARSRERRR
ncbi:MAG: hypothetical protein JHC95_15160 [Solirubrobacteraceae bacterium]|nr:hypothetical protein [Solirubrobacteraceae bacterium]